MKRTPLARKTPLRQTKPIGAGKPRVPIPAINIEATAKRVARRAKERHSAENKAAKALAWERANGVCECGCGLEFDKTWGQHSPDYPEFHHTTYVPPVGVYLRRQCHHRIELANFGHRRHGKVGQ